MKYRELTLGQIEALVNIIGGLEVVMRLLQGAAKVVIEIVKHVIDLDADPYCPDGWKVESHKKGGQMEWTPEKVQLYLSPGQKGGECIGGNELRLCLAIKDQPVYNANLLDYLLAHPELIPAEWKGKYIFFWGTIYRNSGDHLHVRHLRFIGKSWRWSDYRIDNVFSSDDPAAVAGK